MYLTTEELIELVTTGMLELNDNLILRMFDSDVDSNEDLIEI